MWRVLRAQHTLCWPSAPAVSTLLLMASAQMVHTEPPRELGELGRLIDSETCSPSSLVSSFLQPPFSRMTGDLFRNKMSCLFCRHTSSFLCYLGSSAHHPAQGWSPSALPPQWPYPGHPWLVGRRCSVSLLEQRMLSGELPAKKSPVPSSPGNPDWWLQSW